MRLINCYFDYDAREVALYFMCVVNAQALEHRRHPMIWVCDKDQFVPIIAAAGLHKAAVEIFDETAVGSDGPANKLCHG